MTALVLSVLGLVAAMTYVRRLARRGALQLVRDLAASAVLLGRCLYVVGRAYVRMVAGEVRSW